MNAAGAAPATRSAWPSVTPAGICTSTDARVPVVVDRHPAPGAGIGLLHRDIEAPGLLLGLAEPWPAPPARAAEQAGEEIAEPVDVGETLASAAAAEALFPIGRRPELLAGAVVGPQLIVGGALVADP